MLNEIIQRIKDTDERQLSDAYLEELNERMRAACDPARDTKAMKQAVAEWNRVNGYNGEVVPYLQMTSEQRADVIRLANKFKETK
jgi:hypothetical protein